jgi:hypothetical protein
VLFFSCEIWFLVSFAWVHCGDNESRVAVEHRRDMKSCIWLQTNLIITTDMLKSRRPIHSAMGKTWYTRSQLYTWVGKLMMFQKRANLSEGGLPSIPPLVLQFSSNCSLVSKHLRHTSRHASYRLKCIFSSSRAGYLY